VYNFQQLIAPLVADSEKSSANILLNKGDTIESVIFLWDELTPDASLTPGAVKARVFAHNSKIATGEGVDISNEIALVTLIPQGTIIPFTTVAFAFTEVDQTTGVVTGSAARSAYVEIPVHLKVDEATRDIYFDIDATNTSISGSVQLKINRAATPASQVLDDK